MCLMDDARGHQAMCMHSRGEVHGCGRRCTLARTMMYVVRVRVRVVHVLQDTSARVMGGCSFVSTGETGASTIIFITLDTWNYILEENHTNSHGSPVLHTLTSRTIYDFIKKTRG